MSNRAIRVFFWVAATVYMFMLSSSACAQTNVVTQHNDVARTGANTNETILTPANVNTGTFGKLFSYPVFAYVYAQPLYMQGVTMGAGTPQAGTTHNVLFVATEHDTIYAFDADSNGGANASPLWVISLLDAAHGGAGEATVTSSDVGTGDIGPEIGITGTPVIDPVTKTLYVLGKSKLTVSGTTTFLQRLHAIDITTGAEKFGGPASLSSSAQCILGNPQPGDIYVNGNGNGSVGGVLCFDTKWENNRPGLLLLNGIVYIGFAAHGDNGPWHGWLLAYNAANLHRTGVWTSSPNSFGSGMWMSGTGLAADVPVGKPFGRIFTVTGNGIFDATAPNYTNAMDYGDSILRLDLTNGIPTIVDDFTPHDQAALNGADEDQASGGVVVLPDAVGGGGGKHQLVQLGKSGRVYILDRENLGGYTPTNTNDPQQKALTGGLWGAPAYWNGNIYIWGQNDHLKAFSFANGTITSSTPTSKSGESATTYSPTPSVSANGTTNGIVWSLKTDNFGSKGDAILYAHDATNVATLLYSSAVNATRDTPGASVKFVTPTIANGKVYVGTETQVSVFGLLNGVTQASAPVINPVTQSFTTPLQVTITDSTPGAAIYYTTDGSTPTTLSTKYSGPFAVSTTETVTAFASATGYLQSSTASQTYTLQTQALAPTFTPPPTNYQAAQSIAIFDASPSSTIYYTIDGTTPSPGVGTTKPYTAPFTLSTTATVNAVATSPGLTISPVSSGLYTFSLPGKTINFSSGFSTAPSSMTFNGSTGLDDTRLQLTSGLANQAGSAFYNTPVNIQAFTSDFTFQLSNAGADGITFTMQGIGPTALGSSGGGLGYGPDSTAGAPGIGKSVAIKFDTYSNQGEGPSSTGLYQNGVSPTVPSIDLTPAGIDLHSGSTFAAHVGYDGTTLSLTITDPVTTNVFTGSWPVDIPTTVGGPTAYLGFTGGTGGLTSSQKIGTWTFFSTSTQQPAATPTISPAAGVYLGTQIVTITDATSGATIYYTTDGSTPSTASTQYNGPLAVTATETIKAVAKTAATSLSAVASAAYTIEAQVAAPTFSPAGGTFTTPQTVTISTTSPNATIYYTTDGTLPTKSSTLYAGPIAVNASTTIQALATASGFFNSNVTSATYAIGSAVTAIDLGSGFTSGAMIFNGAASLNGSRLRITDGGSNEAASAWYHTPVNIQQFTTNFSFQITGGTAPTADGFAFVIQGGTTAAIGPFGGGLGFGPDSPGGAPGIPKSLAIKFDLYSNAGEGIDSTGLYVNGASPTTPSIDMTNSGVNLHTSDVFNVRLSYDGTNLTMSITDSITNATFTNSWPINIPTTVGANTAFVGFTGGTGGSTAIQDIISWTLTSATSATPAAAPILTPSPGTYTTAQTVTINDATSGATIYYTTNGTTPTTASTKYTIPISVGATETIQAIAVATGYSQSPVASGVYTINLTPTATPTFSPAAGTYSSAQTVTISDATSGATIYYTTNGTAPTAASTVYSGPISVNATETIQAMALATGFKQSAIGSSTYTISSSPIISFGGGFSASGMVFNGSAALSGTRLRLTNGTANQAGTGWYATPVNVQTFTTDFTFQLANPNGDGIAFVIQNAGTAALGPAGGGLGYGPDKVSNPSSSPNTPISKSVAVKFDLASNAGEGTNSTGLYKNGASPTSPAITLGGGVNLHSGDSFKVHLAYDGTTLAMTIADTATPTQTFSYAWQINIPSTVGGNTAYLGFSGGTGGTTATQDIVTWTYSNSSVALKPPVVYQTATLPAVSSGPTFRTLTYAAFPDSTGTILDATKLGDSLKFTLNVQTAGVYEVLLGYKSYNSRGISQLAINGTNSGPTLDQYAPTDSFVTNDYGTFNFPAAGNYTFTFSVTGKNAASAGYSVSFDDITLIPQ